MAAVGARVSPGGAPMRWRIAHLLEALGVLAVLALFWLSSRMRPQLVEIPTRGR